MKILVFNPPSKVTKNVVRDVLYGCWCKGKRIGGATVPPFALLEVATILKKDANEVMFLDAQAERKGLEEIAELVADFEVIVASTSTMTYDEDAEALSQLKKANPRLRTVIFGSHPTFMPEFALARKGIDIIVMREPEFIIRDLIRAMEKQNGSWKKTRGIGFRDDSSIVINQLYPLINDLDELPFPDVTMLPEGVDYFNPIVKRFPYITITTSKGCPGKCTFCTAPAFGGKRVRFQSADYVIREIEYFLKNGYQEVYFRDDTFFVHKRRNSEICKRIIERKLDVAWIGNARIGMIDKEMMYLAKEAGCHLIKLGVESGVQRILDNVNKGYKIEQACETFEWAREVGIDTHAHAMLGIPGDTSNTVERTIQFVKELDPTTATFGICTPYPGSPLFDEVKKKCLQIADGTSVDLSILHTQGTFNKYYTDLTNRDLEKSVRRAYRQFYLRPSYLMKRLNNLKSIDDVIRVSIAATNVLDFSIRGE